ncbi:MAG: diacylglycerol kinase family protein [Candidatus Pseudobacter hemicellulosilyticus]|uniref:Diacylglycerol kinase family protein n=1 Tax=Candidatus Pseudobacter hemicellulosilyticus TaxID=3121375 RepID=A0AAJ5WSG2_9BACT|nr:MAG: diacylglycerol kinase family protein [Pseudobacter sp.]
MKSDNFSIYARLRSFRFAWNGIRIMLYREHNARVHLVATIAVALMAIVFGVTRQELLALLFAVGFVWMAELLNTCVEKLSDFISRDRHPEIGFIKDMAAGAVLVAAVTALATGAIVFIPKLMAG